MNFISQTQPLQVLYRPKWQISLPFHNNTYTDEIPIATLSYTLRRKEDSGWGKYSEPLSSYLFFYLNYYTYNPGQNEIQVKIF